MSARRAVLAGFGIAVLVSAVAVMLAPGAWLDAQPTNRNGPREPTELGPTSGDNAADGDKRLLSWAQSDDGERVYMLLAAGVEWPALIADPEMRANIMLTQKYPDSGSAPPEIEGLLVAGIRDAHPLAKIGIEYDDVLVSINGTRLVDEMTLRALFAANTLPAEIDLAVRREDVLFHRYVHVFYHPSEDEPVEHVVADDEQASLVSLSERYYGTPQLARELQRKNELWDLAPDDQLPAGTTLTIPGHPALRRPARQVGEDRWLVPASERDDGHAELALHIRDLGVTVAERPAADDPAVEAWPEDALAGLELTAPDTGQLAYARGFAPGDVLLAVNGHVLDSLATLLAAAEATEGASFYDVVYVRAGEPHRLIAAVLPAPTVSPDDIELAPVLRLPSAMGCVRLDLLPEDVPGTIRWQLSREFVAFLDAELAALAREVQPVPELDADAGAFIGVRLKYVDRYTTFDELGFVTGDVLLHYRLLPGGEPTALSAIFELAEAIRAASEDNGDGNAPTGIELHIRRADPEAGESTDITWIAAVASEDDSDGDTGDGDGDGDSDADNGTDSDTDTGDGDDDNNDNTPPDDPDDPSGNDGD